VLRSYQAVLVPEMNLGQLSKVVRAEFLVDARPLTKVMGQPFRAGEIERAILDLLDEHHLRTPGLSDDVDKVGYEEKVVQR
jgi:2-oxoglutarate ferredoxin oxidoreductase subunit alpha